MIEDDFDKMFRRMIEQLFGMMNGQPQGGKSPFSIRTIPQNNGPVQRQTEQDIPRVERYDFGTHYVIVVDGLSHEENIEVTVKGLRLYLRQRSPVGKTLDLVLPFDVDVDRSEVSHRNGVTEITLFPLDEIISESEAIERKLRIL